METATTGNSTLAGHLVVGADSTGLSAARRQVHSIARNHFTEDEAHDIVIAVGEAISNAYRHGTPDRKYGLIYVDWSYTNRTLTVSIKDDGPGMSPETQALLFSKAPRRGRGFDIIKRTVDDVYVEHDNGTRLVLTKRSKWTPQDLLY